MHKFKKSVNNGWQVRSDSELMKEGIYCGNNFVLRRHIFAFWSLAVISFLNANACDLPMNIFVISQGDYTSGLGWVFNYLCQINVLNIDTIYTARAFVFWFYSCADESHLLQNWHNEHDYRKFTSNCCRIHFVEWRNWQQVCGDYQNLLQFIHRCIACAFHFHIIRRLYLSTSRIIWYSDKRDDSYWDADWIIVRHMETSLVIKI